MSDELAACASGRSKQRLLLNALYRVVVYTSSSLSPTSQIMEETDKIVLTTIKAA